MLLTHDNSYFELAKIGDVLLDHSGTRLISPAVQLGVPEVGARGFALRCRH